MHLSLPDVRNLPKVKLRLRYNFLYLPIDFQSRACLGYAQMP